MVDLLMLIERKVGLGVNVLLIYCDIVYCVFELVEGNNIWCLEYNFYIVEIGFD